ncbi:MAG: hypothetical protein ABSA58_15270 [Acetobacteraceae bacterium]
MFRSTPTHFRLARHFPRIETETAPHGIAGDGEALDVLHPDIHWTGACPRSGKSPPFADVEFEAQEAGGFFCRHSVQRRVDHMHSHA